MLESESESACLVEKCSGDDRITVHRDIETFPSCRKNWGYTASKSKIQTKATATPIENSSHYLLATDPVSIHNETRNPTELHELNTLQYIPRCISESDISQNRTIAPL
jgi:hypothetical protein